MGTIQDLTGRVFGRLTVLSHAGQNKHWVSMWNCRCECGTEKIVSSMGMKAGKTKSCGCFRATALKEGRTALVASQTRHGKSRTREHHIWANLLYRCQKEGSRQYEDYGGRGITVCDRWQGRHGFENFLADMGKAPSRTHTLDRIDNNGPYSPENCRWATARQQALNRRDNRILEYRGERKALQEWADQFGIHKATLHGRLRKGWTVAKALETPPRGK